MGKIAKLEKKVFTSEGEIQQIKLPKIRNGKYTCPACGSPFAETVVKRFASEIFLGIILLTTGLLLIVFLIINLITGRLSEDLRGGCWIAGLIVGIAFNLAGAYLLQTKGEACPICRRRLEKVGDRYRIPPPSGGF